MLNGLKAMPDKLGFEKPTMKMMLPIPPIGIFAVNRKKQLKVVAIQESSTPSNFSLNSLINCLPFSMDYSRWMGGKVKPKASSPLLNSIFRLSLYFIL